MIFIIVSNGLSMHKGADEQLVEGLLRQWRRRKSCRFTMRHKSAWWQPSNFPLFFWLTATFFRLRLLLLSVLESKARQSLQSILNSKQHLTPGTCSWSIYRNFHFKCIFVRAWWAFGSSRSEQTSQQGNDAWLCTVLCLCSFFSCFLQATVTSCRHEDKLPFTTKLCTVPESP